MPERWLPVVGYEGLYEVSDRGRVKSSPRRGSVGGIRKLFLSPRGYLTLALSKGNVRRTYPVHRLVAPAFLGPPPPGTETRHLDGNPLNNDLANLAYGTPSENEYDKVRHGTHQQARKTHCDSGHEFTPDNTIRRRGRVTRQCRACMCEYNRQYRQRVKARLLAGGMANA